MDVPLTSRFAKKIEMETLEAGKLDGREKDIAKNIRMTKDDPKIRNSLD